MAEKEYIEREAFRQQLKHRQITEQYTNARERHEIGCIIEMLDKAPAADVAPVVHGEWRWEGKFKACSKCGTHVEWAETLGSSFWNYCPYCGAKMDGGKVNE